MKSTPIKSKKKPAEIIVEKGQQIPIYHTPDVKGGKIYDSFTIVTIQAGKRVRQRASTIELARSIAISTARQLSEGIGHIQTLQPKEVGDYTAAMQILRKHPGVTLGQALSEWAAASKILDGGSIISACEHFTRFQKKKAIPRITVATAVKDFLAAKERAGVSKRYTDQLKYRLKPFTKRFRCDVASITTSDLQSFLDDTRLSPRTRINYRESIQTLFNHLRRHGFLPREESTEAEHLDRPKATPTDIGIYTPENIQRVLDCTLPAKNNLASIGIALGAFAGLRSAEIHRLSWSDIGEKYITIKPLTAKTGSRRIIPILEPLKAVIDIVGRGKGAIHDYKNETHLCGQISAAFSGVGIEPIHNGLRHSFCSYRLAQIKNAAQVSLEAGNSPKTLFKHYAELVTEEQATAWFNIAPKVSSEKVVSFAA